MQVELSLRWNFITGETDRQQAHLCGQIKQLLCKPCSEALPALCLMRQHPEISRQLTIKTIVCTYLSGVNQASFQSWSTADNCNCHSGFHLCIVIKGFHCSQELILNQSYRFWPKKCFDQLVCSFLKIFCNVYLFL